MHSQIRNHVNACSLEMSFKYYATVKLENLC